MTENTQDWHQNTDFTQHSHKDWRHAVDELLAGAAFEKMLVSSTFDDIKIQPLYQQNKDAPFIGRGETPWSIQQSYFTGTIEEVNHQILSDLSAGVNSVELMLAITREETANKQSALPCYSAEDVARLLAGVHMEMIQLSLSPGSVNRLTGALLLAYCHRQKTAPENLHCALNIDPLKSLAETGLCPDAAIATLAQYASYCANQFPNVTSLCVDSNTYHNAGCTDAQEIAYCLATTVEYLRSMQSLTVDTALSQIRYRVALDSDFFLNVAKLRATRELLRQVQESCGAKPATSRSATTQIDAVSGARALTTLDSATNILRLSTQTAAAMAGGANGFNCTAYDHLTGTSTKAQRLARNTHHILIEESGLLNVDDPTRGSGYIEAMTQQLCESAWSLFQKIESAGGMQKALTSGLIAEQISQSCQKRTTALSTGESTIVGVTAFADIQEPPSHAHTPGCVSNSKHTDHNSSAESPASVVALVNSLSEGGTTLEHLHHCSGKITSKALEAYRDAELFEQLRLRSHAYETANGDYPEVTLLTIGSHKDFSARTGFCKNLFAVAGIKTTLAEFDSVLQANTTNGNRLFVLCSSDKLYLDNIEKIASLETIDNNKNKGTLWIAGNNPKVLSRLGDSISESIHLRCNKIEALNNALTLIGVPV